MKKIKYTFRGPRSRKVDGNYLILNKSNVQLYCDIMNLFENNYNILYDPSYWVKYIYYKYYMTDKQKEEFINRADKYNNDLQFKDKFNRMLG